MHDDVPSEPDDLDFVEALGRCVIAALTPQELAALRTPPPAPEDCVH